MSQETEPSDEVVPIPVCLLEKVERLEEKVDIAVLKAKDRVDKLEEMILKRVDQLENSIEAKAQSLGQSIANLQSSIEKRLSTLGGAISEAKVLSTGLRPPVGQDFYPLYKIRRVHGTYLRTQRGGRNAIVDLASTAGPNSTYELVWTEGGRIAIRSKVHNTFVRGHPGGNDSIVDMQICDPSKWRGQTWEQFRLISTDSGRYKIMSSLFGSFMRAHPNGSKVGMQCDDPARDNVDWEEFELIPG